MKKQHTVRRNVGERNKKARIREERRSKKKQKLRKRKKNNDEDELKRKETNAKTVWRGGGREAIREGMRNEKYED